MKLIASMNKIVNYGLYHQHHTSRFLPFNIVVHNSAMCMPNYFINALEFLPYNFMGAAPLHTYIGDFILHLYVPLIRDMKSLRVLFNLSKYAF